MQADLCDNCKTPAGEGDEGHDGWIKVAKMRIHSGGHEDVPPQIQALMQQMGQAQPEIPPHLCPKIYDLCGDQCAALFIINGYKPNIEGLFNELESLTPADFVDATSKAPEEPQG